MPEATEYVSACACVFMWMCVHANASEWWLTLRHRGAICSPRDTKKETAPPSGLSGLRMCACMDVYMHSCAPAHVRPLVLWFVYVHRLTNKWMHLCVYTRERVCCLKLKHDNLPFFSTAVSFSSKNRLHSFRHLTWMTLNLLWRDLGVNLFPVEKAKPWSHKPKNNTCVRFGKPFMALVCNVLAQRSITEVNHKVLRRVADFYFFF